MAQPSPTDLYRRATTDALAVAEELADQVSVEVFDPRTLYPFDIDGLIEALRGLAALSAAKREQVIEVLRMTTRGGLG